MTEIAGDATQLTNAIRMRRAASKVVQIFSRKLLTQRLLQMEMIPKPQNIANLVTKLRSAKPVPVFASFLAPFYRYLAIAC